MIRNINAKSIPTLACLGYASKLSDPELTQSKDYVKIVVDLEPSTRMGQKKKYYFCFRPEWFTREFNPNTDLSKSQAFVFSKNVFDADGNITALQALCGSEENFQTLENALYELEEHTVETVGQAIVDFLVGLGKVEFIYILKQGTEKTGNLTAEGKTEKVKTRFRDVAGFLRADERGKKSVIAKRKYAERQAEKDTAELGEEQDVMFQIAFDLDAI